MVYFFYINDFSCKMENFIFMLEFWEMHQLTPWNKSNLLACVSAKSNVTSTVKLLVCPNIMSIVVFGNPKYINLRILLTINIVKLTNLKNTFLLF